jgi:hypothetical protein
MIPVDAYMLSEVCLDTRKRTHARTHTHTQTSTWPLTSSIKRLRSSL